MSLAGFPRKQGLYDPAHEHDSCGVGFVVDLKARKTHTLVMQAVEVLLSGVDQGDVRITRLRRQNVHWRGCSGREVGQA